MSRIKDSPMPQSKVSPFPLEEKICFGFSHITTNNHYSFAEVAKGDKVEAYEKLIEKLQELSSINIMEARQRGKKLGAERIPYEQLSEAFQSVCDSSKILSRDDKVIVFQFCNHKYRLICKDDLMRANLLHILGFDFDFTAYNHG